MIRETVEGLNDADSFGMSMCTPVSLEPFSESFFNRARGKEFIRKEIQKLVVLVRRLFFVVVGRIMIVEFFVNRFVDFIIHFGGIFNKEVFHELTRRLNTLVFVIVSVRRELFLTNEL